MRYKIALRQQETAREVAAAKLEAIKLVLRDANDNKVMKVVQPVIDELQGSIEKSWREVAATTIIHKIQRVRASRAVAAFMHYPLLATRQVRKSKSSVTMRPWSSRTVANRVVSRVAEATAAIIKDWQGSRAAESLDAAKTSVADKGRAFVSWVASGVAAGFEVAHETLAGFANNLDWSTLPKEYADKFVEAGTRGIDRTLVEARLVWETIPEQLRALGPEELAKRLDGFDWSHIIPHSRGGSNEASNGIFELAGLNRSRGAEQMTAAEIQAAQQVLSDQAFRAILSEAASQAFTGAAAAAAVGCVLSCLEHGLEYQRGLITSDEMYRRIRQTVVKTAAVGAAVSGVMTVVALAFPALLPLAAPLMLPLALVGLCAVGGKVVLLSKEWYELLPSIIDARRRSGRSPIKLLPLAEASTSG